MAVALLSEEQAQEGFAPESLFSGQWCTGVLIAPTVVVTAGHCVEQCFRDTCTDADGEPFDCSGCDPDLIPATRVYISAGARTLDEMWSAEVVPVRELFVPEGYVRSLYWYLDLGLCEPVGFEEYECEKPGLTPDLHDIAVLLLDAPVTSLSPIRILPKTDDLVGTEALAIGYGDRISPGNDELLSQDRYVSILNQTSTPVEQVTDQEILTAAGENQSGTCFGDSGGPLYVQRGGEVFVAGIASRLRNDREGLQCGAGAIHTLAPAYADWIFEKAPEANRLTLSGGGGCSASSGRPPPSGLLGLALFAVFWSLRRRQSIVAGLALVVPLSLLAACGSSSATDPSFCTEKYDPSGALCNPDVSMLDLPTAHALAQLEVPDDAFLFAVRSAYSGLLDPDGRSNSWTFTYYIPGRRELPEAEFLEVAVTATETIVYYAGWEILRCLPTEPIPVLDSRQVIHDAIRMFESSGRAIRLEEEGATLRMEQQHICLAVGALRNSVRFGDAAVFFNDDGVVVALDENPST